MGCKYLLVLALILAGCDTRISNDEVVAEVSKCRAGGMSYLLHTNMLGSVSEVSCYYAKDKK